MRRDAGARAWVEPGRGNTLLDGAPTTRHHGGWVVVAVDGDVDLYTGARMRVGLAEPCTGCPWLVVDCAALTFCDSRAL